LMVLSEKGTTHNGQNQAVTVLYVPCSRDSRRAPQPSPWLVCCAASEPSGNSVKLGMDFHLKAKARIWPWLCYRVDPLMRNCFLLGPYSGVLTRALRWS